MNSGRPQRRPFFSEVFMRKIQAMTLILGAMAVGAAQSATTPASFQVTANLQATCSASAALLAFGAYTPGGGALAANTNITVKCTKNTPFTVSLNGGSGGGTIAQRLMLSGTTNHLQYNLYSTAALNTVFGDGTNSSVTVGGTGAGVATANQVLVPVFGQVPDNATNQLAVPGAYADTIAVTVTY
jgi:spore coat protein U-like protein